MGDLPYLIEKLDVLVPPQDVLVPIPSVEKEVFNNYLWCSQRTTEFFEHCSRRKQNKQSVH